MSSLSETIANLPTRILAAGETLVAEGESSGEIHVLVDGALNVERAGVALVTLDSPGALVGEMSVLLSRPATATVRAKGPAQVRTIADAARALQSDPQLVFRIAALLAARLDATSSLLVELSREEGGQAPEQGLFRRIFSVLAKDNGLAVVDRDDLFGDTELWAHGRL